ncbi:hypothetical protein [Candidatus Palauibacter sp.]|uniref:hypothetical protein n=1 Tax=Candidatus Palauibacter sp. TaxID=3101350 RepID=UPI003B02193B
MLDFIGNFLWLIVTGVLSIGGYVTMKKFVHRRLRFVDGVHRRGVPVLAGVAAWAVALPAAILPILNPITAILFGIGIGAGVAAGRREIKRLPSP